MRKYKVYFEGVAYVEAENRDAANAAWEEGEELYSEMSASLIEEVDEFTVEV